MKWFIDIHYRNIRLTQERQEHIENDHPEMSGQLNNIRDTLLNPDTIIKSRTDEDVELFINTIKSLLSPRNTCV